MRMSIWITGVNDNVGGCGGGETEVIRILSFPQSIAANHPEVSIRVVPLSHGEVTR